MKQLSKEQMDVNNKLITFENGHTIEEWNALFANLPEDESMWDFSLEDFTSGAIEPCEDILYWYIGGRMYETDFEVGQNNSK